MTQNIQSKFYCIQPIYIDLNLLSNLYKARLDMSALNNFSLQTIIPVWKKEMDELYNLYNSIIVTNHPSVNTATLINDLQTQEYFINDIIDITSFIVEHQTKSYLLFDYRLFQFILVYELSLCFPEALADTLLEIPSSRKFSLKKDLYNSVRNIFVKRDNTSQLPPTIETYMNNTFSYITQLLSTVCHTKVQKDSIRIIPNTGNITNILIINNTTGDRLKQIAKKILDLNIFAERISGYSSPINLHTASEFTPGQTIDYSTELYFFNGRFHTIILHSDEYQYRYIPLQFQMQYLWFFLSKQLNPLLDKYNNTIQQSKITLSELSSLSDELDIIINKVELLNIYNEKFKLSLEADNKLYAIIEKKWNIERMLLSSNTYIQFFKDYLNRLFTRKSSKIEQRQNKILFFLSAIQFIALISVWNDYLSLLDNNFSYEFNKILIFFNSFENLENFNFYLPIIFLITISILLYIANKHHE